MANNFSHILTLDEAKRYLRLDPDFVDDDPDIERMINSAFGYIEKQTNHIFRVQDRTYYKDYNGYINIYDYPINTVDFPDGIFPLRYSGFTRFVAESITVNVGYSSSDKAPSELIECALQMIKVWYYEAEKNENTTLLPLNVMEIINSNKRFFAC